MTATFRVRKGIVQTSTSPPGHQASPSNTQRILFGDTQVKQWKEAGLLYPAVVTGIVRTIKGNLIMRKLGVLLDSDVENVTSRV